MPIDRLTPQRRREMTREALIRAAMEVFTGKGFYAASLDEIADAAGFTKGAIYSNFGSKEELLWAVIDHVKNIQLVRVAAAMEADPTDDPLHIAGAAANAWARMAGPGDDFIALELELRLYALRNPEARERIAELDREVSDQLAGFIEEEFTRRNRPLARSARDLADLGRAAVDGLEQMAAIDETRAPDYRRLTESLFRLLAGLAAEDQGPSAIMVKPVANRRKRQPKRQIRP